MKTDSIIITADDYYGELCNPDNFMDMKDGYEAYRYWPDHISSGFFYMIKFRPGLILTIINHRPIRPVTIQFKQSSSCFILSFILTGGINIRTMFNNGLKENSLIILDSVQSYLSNTFGSHGVANYPPSPYCAIAVSIEPWLLKQFWDGEDGGFPDDVHGRLCGQAAGTHYHHPLRVTPVINMRLHEILGCRYQGANKRFYLESKVLELLVLGLSQLKGDDSPRHPRFISQSDEYEFVRKARDIMIKNMKNPPSLSDLSRQVGVNKKKLNLCFREVYGTSIFDYLRICRLEKSRDLLRYSRKNVTEVAFEVGYAQQSSFTKEFNKYFGTSPRDYRS